MVRVPGLPTDEVLKADCTLWAEDIPTNRSHDVAFQRYSSIGASLGSVDGTGCYRGRGTIGVRAITEQIGADLVHSTHGDEVTYR